jgi:hypothetical protein
MTTATNWLLNFAIAYSTPYMVNEGDGYANLQSKVFFVSLPLSNQPDLTNKVLGLGQLLLCLHHFRLVYDLRDQGPCARTSR